MNLKTFITRVLVGIAITGMVWGTINLNDNNDKLFANKERCVRYTERRQIEAEEKYKLLGNSISVQGFYSPTENTCMTNSQEIATGHYIQRTLIDELTGITEAFAFQSTGQEFLALSLEEKQEQIAQDKLYGERLQYYQGEDNK